MAGPLTNFVRLIERSIDAGNTPIVWGPSGVGKSALVEDIARRRGMDFIPLYLSQCDPTDVGGFPVVTDSKVKDAAGREVPLVLRAPPGWGPRINTSRRTTLLFLDEYNCCAESTLAAALNLTNERRVGDYQLDRHRVAVVLAANPPDIAVNAVELKPPSANRLVHLQFPMGDGVVRNWCEDFPGYWGNPPEVGLGGRTDPDTGKVDTAGGKYVPESVMLRARTLVAQYLLRFPDRWHAMPADSANRGTAGWPSPRSWTMASRDVGLCLADGLPATEALTLVAGAVGDGDAAQFMAYAKTQSAPDPEALLADPDSYSPTDRVDENFGTMIAVAAAVTSGCTAKRLRAGWKVINRAVTAADTPAYEAGTAAAVKLVGLMKTGSPTAAALLKEVGEEGVTRLVQDVTILSKPYYKLFRELGMIGS